MSYECPKCGCTTFEFEVSQTARVDFDDVGDHDVEEVSGDVEWTDDTIANCVDCDHGGPLGSMTGVPE